MLLQTKINYRFLALLLVVFLFAGVILYVVTGLVVDDSFDDNLKNRSIKIKEHLKNQQLSDSLIISADESIIIKQIDFSIIKRRYSDTSIYEKTKKENIEYRKMIFGVQANNKNYEVTLLLSKLETEDLIELIFLFMLGLFILIGFILFFFNRWISSSVWHPFYETLERLKVFKVSDKQEVLFKNTDIYEFEQLNNSLTLMINKIHTDFNNLKEFTENASHEIQTPIAVIKSKLETVLQEKSLSDESNQHIQSAFQSVSRLSKLNEALLLLSKIDNQQFTVESEVNICDIIYKRLTFIEELIEFKKIELTLRIEIPFIIKINKYLAEILINNLIGNAVKHNIEGGKILITSSANQLIISNSGKPLEMPPEKLFQRFVKHNAGNESTGLGLAIVNEICKNYGLEVNYEYINGFHYLIINQHNR